MNFHIHTICIPTRPQPDTLVAIYLLKTYGKQILPKIESATYKILSQVDPAMTEFDYLQKGELLLDVGGGNLDHHSKKEKTTVSKLVAEFLEITKDKTIEKMLAYAERDDFFGKGTQSNDPLDKAFGLSGLIAVLNKQHEHDIVKVIDTVLILLEAHHYQEKKRVEEFPLEIENLKKEGKFEKFEIKQKNNLLKVCFLESDNVGLPGYLRAVDGGRFDIVVQKRTTGHVNILTKPLKKPDLRKIVERIRSEEYFIKNNKKSEKKDIFQKVGRIEEVPEWYYDTATNSLQNGGVNPQGTNPTMIKWSSVKIIVKEALEELVFSTTKLFQNKEILYIALFIQNPQDILLSFEPKHSHVFAHHITLAFKPQTVNPKKIGKKVRVKIIARIFDEKGDVLLVDIGDEIANNKYPHITLSCAEGISPVYSNELIEKAVLEDRIEYFDKIIEVDTIYGYENRENKVIIK